jgi:hypothetical protein
LDDLDILAGLTKNRAIGPYWDVIQAPSFTTHTATVRLGVLNESFVVASKTGTAVAQYIYIVRYGLMNAERLFNGVKRRMKFGDDMHADQKILIYAWRPEADFEWVGGRQSLAFPRKQPALPGRIFVVLVRPFDRPDGNKVSGTILKWNWIHGDLNSTPMVDGEDRYIRQVWSKGS